MEIGIIGSGAIGMLCGAYLSIEHVVTLYTRREEQADQINKNGISLWKNEHLALKMNPRATAEATYKEPLLIVTVKHYQLPGIINKLKELSPRMIVFLQNGMGHLNLLQTLTSHHVFVGAVEHGALKINDHGVHHTGIGCIKISSFRNENEVLPILHPQIDDFPFEYNEDWKSMLSKKLLVNACINPLTAVLRVPNGELAANQSYKKMAEAVFKEASKVLQLQNEESEWENILQICRNTAVNRSSMLKDVEEGRKTEIEGIVGYLINHAIKERKEVPILEFLYHAIRGMEG
ncbi:2-dehydropantoate 2-reductase [Metabacillus idriensis]|uniref:2-dehydropantoate 2-reductase n=1 Tax=Metabacillus idriensis TaxID=324768 RepID=UPI00174D4455|nr:2-dehydropantoate 2-reductase [Metabacillus idriensis]